MPGCEKLNAFDVPVLVVAKLPLSQTSGWLVKVPLKVAVSPVLIVVGVGLYA